MRWRPRSSSPASNEYRIARQRFSPISSVDTSASAGCRSAGDRAAASGTRLSAASADRILDRRAAIHDARLERRVVRTRPQVPPDPRGVRDHPGRDERVRRAAVFAPARKRLPAVPCAGMPLNTIRRKDIRPVRSPSQNGELHDSASRCGRKYRIWFMRSMRSASSSIPTCTCSPQIIMRRATPCISSSNAT